MLLKILDVLQRSGCDRLEFEVDIDTDCLRITAHRTNPPLAADIAIPTFIIELAQDDQILADGLFDELIRKLP